MDEEEPSYGNRPTTKQQDGSHKIRDFRASNASEAMRSQGKNEDRVFDDKYIISDTTVMINSVN